MMTMWFVYCSVTTPLGLVRRWMSSVCPRGGFYTREEAEKAASTIWDPAEQLTITIEEK